MYLYVLCLFSRHHCWKKKYVMINEKKIEHIPNKKKITNTIFNN